MSTSDQVRAQLALKSTTELLDQLESFARMVATTEALARGGPIAEHDFIPYNVFRRELPLIRKELLNRLAPAICSGRGGWAGGERRACAV